MGSLVGIGTHCPEQQTLLWTPARRDVTVHVATVLRSLPDAPPVLSLEQRHIGGVRPWQGLGKRAAAGVHNGFQGGLFGHVGVLRRANASHIHKRPRSCGSLPSSARLCRWPYADEAHATWERRLK